MPSEITSFIDKIRLLINEYTVVAFLSIVVSIVLLLTHFIEGQQFVALVIAIVMLSIAVKVLPQLEVLSILGCKIKLQAKISEAEELIKRLDDLDYETKILELNSKMPLPRGNASLFYEPRVDVLVAYCQKQLMGNVSDKFKKYLLDYSINFRNGMVKHLKNNSGLSSDDLQASKMAILQKKLPTTDTLLDEYIFGINKLNDLCLFIQEKLTPVSM